MDYSVGDEVQLKSTLFVLMQELADTGYHLSYLRRLLWHVHARMPFLKLPELLDVEHEKAYYDNSQAWIRYRRASSQLCAKAMATI